MGVIFHYLNMDLKVDSMLVRIRRLEGAHTGENINEVVIPITKATGVTDHFGFFIRDNAGPNDTAIRVN